MRTEPLKITAYFDTRAGHIKQTRGLIQALYELTDVHVEEIFLPEYGIPESLYDWISFAVSFFKNPPKQLVSSQDLIIGTGTHTHIPMLLQKRQSGGKVITCMMPEPPLLKYIDLCFVPEHDAPPLKDNIFTTHGPPNTAVDRHEHDPQKGLIVIGGIDNKSHIWDNGKIAEQIRAILKIQPDIVWTISTSPRTPDKMISMLDNLSKDFPYTNFIPFEKTAQGWIEKEYAKSSFVWVSADSVSMVFEALSAGCRVGVLSVEWKKDKNKIARAVKLLEQKKRIVSFKNFMNKTQYPAQGALNEAMCCAEEILKRWWPDRLPINRLQ